MDVRATDVVLEHHQILGTERYQVPPQEIDEMLQGAQKRVRPFGKIYINEEYTVELW
jgi:hypothetical protein